MTRNRIILVVFALLALLLPLGGPAYADEPPNGPDLCDGPDCGPNPPPPPPPPPPPGEPPPPPPEPAYVPLGWFDTISDNGTAYGWACDANDYNASLWIHFYEGGEYRGATLANEWRQDVADAGWPCAGTGNHGWSFELPVSMRNGASHPLTAYAINIGPEGSNPALEGSPKWYAAGANDPWYANVVSAYYADGISDEGGWSYYGRGCRSPIARREYRGMFGHIRWIYYEQVHFCWGSGRITSFWRERWHHQNGGFFNGWSFEGHINSNCLDECRGRGVGSWSTSAWTQGQFRFCTFKIVVCHEVTPLLGIRVYGDGSFRLFQDYPQ
jgi:hypothetical protein